LEIRKVSGKKNLKRNEKDGESVFKDEEWSVKKKKKKKYVKWDKFKEGESVRKKRNYES
jgi:hypothetical protein